ncbi:unnamed protein product [Caenorhabditis angaria]|uniref:L-Fucosyltransferase n=1 Tax=Caenorhabditis angaria TaxID=860376 RepID=A0A9P1I556_9PELO|nr:unnamed protein product [Caenorhabditis angaria]
MKYFHIIGYIIALTISIHFVFVYFDTSNWVPVKESKYLTATLFTVNQAGLGNCLFEVVALRGIAQTTNRIAFVNSNEKELIGNFEKRIGNSFPELYKQFEIKNVDKDDILRVPFQGECCIQTHPRGIKNISHQFMHIEGAYYQSFKYFDHIREDVREWLKPADKYFLIADSYLPKKEQKDKFKICTHIRRGDFATDKMHAPTNSNFTIRALKFLVSEYDFEHHNNMMLVFLGNDEKFENELRTQIQNIDTITLPKSDPEIDLAFSRKYCDVVLITAPSSTFGWWLGYLSKTGNEVYYEDILETGDKVAYQMHQQDFYPNNWIKLKTYRRDGSVNKL